MNCVDFHMNPQEALDAPRWQWEGGTRVSCEPGFSDNTARKLCRMGHDVRLALHSTNFGRGQMICRASRGTLVGGTEPRTDGAVEAW
jgi:gamma-glutamyltranspeptidase/glutathione hydrolase